MEGRGLRLTRRAALAAGAAALVSAPTRAPAFGQAGAFHARVLTTGGRAWRDPRSTAPGRWAWELVRRTSAPGKLVAGSVGADSRALLAEPFAVWPGAGKLGALSAAEVRGLERFIRLGGVLIVDDSDPGRGEFRASAQKELARVVPESPVVRLDAGHVIYKSFYILDRPVGRVRGPKHIDAIVRGGTAQVIFLKHDLLGALARSRRGGWALQVDGGFRQREYAVRLAVNLAMYVLCSDYKGDQVHAPWLMRRRARRRR